jgi:hypothetical protein
MLSSLPGTGSVDYSDVTLRINGKVIVDRPLNLSNVTILFGVNGQLEVKTGFYITASCSAFKGCNNKWKGILLNTGARVISKNTLFQDAVAAITFADGYTSPILFKSELKYCIFRNNGTGIASGGLLGSNIGKGLVLIGNQFFRTTSSLFLRQETRALALGRKTIGIFGSQGDVNVISEMGSGFYLSSGASVSIFNFKFKNIARQSIVLPDGVAIYMLGGALTVGGTDSWKKCVFEDVGWAGVYAESAGVRFFVENCDFKNSLSSIGETGILLKAAPDNCAISVQRCSLSFHKTAISISRAPNLGLPNTVNRVSGNVIQEFVRNGIIVNAPVLSADVFEVANNNPMITKINGSNCRGISISGTQNALSVTGNVLNFDSEAPIVYTGDDCCPSTFGIAFQFVKTGLKKNVISGNTIKAKIIHNPFNQFGANQNGYSQVKCGMHLEASQNLVVDNNTVGNCFRDFHMQDNCSGMEWKCNIMLTAYTGLALWGDKNMMSNQSVNGKSYGNIWDNNSTFRRAAWATTGSGTVYASVPDKIWFVDDGGGNKPVAPIEPNNDWFRQTLTYESCGVNPDPPLNVDLIPSEIDLVNSRRPFTNLEKWSVTSGLLTKLREQPELLNQQAISNWYATQVSEAEKQLWNLYLGINSNIIVSARDSKQQQIGRLLEQIDATDTSDYNNAQFEEIMALMHELEPLITADASNRIILLTNTRNQISGLTLTGIEKASTQKRMIAEIDALLGLSPNQDLAAELVTIVNSCSDVVCQEDRYRASEVLHQFGFRENVLQESDYSSCFSIQNREAKPKLAEGRYVFPSIATTSIKIHSDVTEVRSNISIYDQLGRRLYFSANDINEIDVSSLNSGGYVLTYEWADRLFSLPFFKTTQ